MNTLAGRFPHSEICGSMLICQLTAAYRRLSRLSSPIIAKASTTCSCSLDPITLTFFSQEEIKLFNQGFLSGLSPDALCRNVNNSLVSHYQENDSSLLKFKTLFKFALTQSKLSSEARLHLHAFPLTTLISTL